MEVRPYFVRSCERYSEGYGSHMHYKVGTIGGGEDVCGEYRGKMPIGPNHQVLVWEGIQNQHVIKVAGKWFDGRGDQVPNPFSRMFRRCQYTFPRGSPWAGRCQTRFLPNKEGNTSRFCRGHRMMGGEGEPDNATNIGHGRPLIGDATKGLHV